MRWRVRYPLRWVLAIVVSAAFLLLMYTPHLPHPMMSDDGYPIRGPWWDFHGPERHGWLHHPPYGGPGRFNEDFAPPPPAWSSETWRLTPSQLRMMIEGTDGFYVRDWSVGLGWNNVSNAQIIVMSPRLILILAFLSFVTSSKPRCCMPSFLIGCWSYRRLYTPGRANLPCRSSLPLTTMSV